MVLDNVINIGDWVYLGFTTRVFKVKAIDSQRAGFAIITIAQPNVNNRIDAERTHLNKITDINTVNNLNSLYPDL